MVLPLLAARSSRRTDVNPMLAACEWLSMISAIVAVTFALLYTFERGKRS